jgi:hypothetical protein
MADKFEIDTSPTEAFRMGLAEGLARRFYEARPAGCGISRFTWAEAQTEAAPYVADLRCFAAIAVGLKDGSTPGGASPARSGDAAGAGGIDG